MASIVKTDDGYRVFIHVKGKRTSKRFKSYREATAFAATTESDLRTEATVAPAKRITLGKAMERYRDEVSAKKRGARWEQIRINKLITSASFPHAKLLGDVTPDDLGLWRDMSLLTISEGSVLREIGLLSAFFECARLEWRWVAVNPVKDVRKPSKPLHRERLITRAEIRAMLVAMGYRKGKVRSVADAVAHAFLLALRTGMRAGEICALTPGQIKPGYLANVGTKTRPRSVPLSAKSLAIIAAMQGFDSDTVFGLHVNSLDTLFRRYRQRAGLSGFTFHDTRHTAATWLSRKLNTLDLCRMFGWTTATRALTYVNTSAADIAKQL